MSGAVQPASSIRCLISGTAAAASGTLTVTRTISEPASASSMHCCAVAARIGRVGHRHRLHDDRARRRRPGRGRLSRPPSCGASPTVMEVHDSIHDSMLSATNFVMIASARMKAFVVHEFGGPDVMQLEEVADPKPGADRGRRARPRRRRQSGRRLHPHRHLRAQAGAAVHAGLGRRRRNRSGRRRRQGVQAAAIASTSAASATPPAGAGTYAEHALCAPSQLHRLPARVVVRAGRGARRAVLHRVSRAVPARAGEAGRDRARARRDRRRRHRRASSSRTRAA